MTNKGSELRATMDTLFSESQLALTALDAGDARAGLHVVKPLIEALGLVKQVEKKQFGDSPPVVLARQLLERLGDLHWPFVVRLVDALREKRLTDFAILAAVTMQRAQLESNGNDHDGTQALYEVARRCYAAGLDDEGARRAQDAAADALVAKAEWLDRASTGPSLLAISAYADALKALRMCRGRQDLRQRVHRRLLELQVDVPRFMGRVEVPFDLSRIASMVRDKLKNLSRPDAIVWLAAEAASLVSRDGLESTDAGGVSGLFANIPTAWSANDGRTVATTSGTDDDAVSQLALTRLLVSGGILGAALAVYRERFADETATAGLLPEPCELVQPVRLQSVGTAAVAGLEGNWEVAMPLLFPQVEHIFRTILSKSVTLSDENPDFQRFPDLGAMLKKYEKELAQAIGERDAFAWRMLCATAGGDRRNRVLHGLDDDANLGGPHDHVVWWLFLRLTLFGGDPRRQTEPPPT